MGGKPVQQDLCETFLNILPDDGTPVSNRTMRLMVSRALERSVSAEEYIAVRDALLEEGRVGRARGPGGQVFLLQDKSLQTPTPEPMPKPIDDSRPRPYFRPQRDRRATTPLPEGFGAESGMARTLLWHIYPAGPIFLSSLADGPGTPIAWGLPPSVAWSFRAPSLTARDSKEPRRRAKPWPRGPYYIDLS